MAKCLNMNPKKSVQWCNTHRIEAWTMTTLQLKVVACYTNKICLQFVLLKTADRSIVNFPDRQAGSNTFCQNGEYLGKAENTEANDPGKLRRNMERDFKSVCSGLWEKHLPMNLIKDWHSESKLFLFLCFSWGVISGHHHMPPSLHLNGHQVLRNPPFSSSGIFPSPFLLTCHGLTPGLWPLLLSLLDQLHPPHPPTPHSQLLTTLLLIYPCSSQTELSGIKKCVPLDCLKTFSGLWFL